MKLFVPALLGSILSTIIILAACNKEDGKPTADLLMQKWTVVQTADTLYLENAAPAITAYEGTSADYWDLSTNGTMYASVNNAKDTSAYTYSDMNLKLNVKGYHFYILTLTETSMVLYDPRYSTNVVGYTAAKVVLKR